MARIVLREQVVMPWAGAAIFAALVAAITGAIMGVVAGKNRLLAVAGLLLTVAIACGFIYTLPQLQSAVDLLFCRRESGVHFLGKLAAHRPGHAGACASLSIFCGAR